MNPATRAPARRDGVRLLAIDRASGKVLDGGVEDLPSLLRRGDLVIVNDAATLPASIRGETEEGCAIEVRLAGLGAEGVWQAVLFGDGDWRVPTEMRPDPPALTVGARLRLGRDDADTGPDRGLVASVVKVDDRHRRLVTLVFEADEDELWAALYREGTPIQYAYTDDDFELWTVQSAFAGPPWAAEMASAGRPLSWRVLEHLQRSGVELAALTHAAGLSSTGDDELDRLLPLPERYMIPAETVDAIERTQARGGRVIAVGTTVIRALEGCAATHGILRAGSGVTDLILDRSSPLAIVDGVLTGMHGPGESHRRLLEAFAPASVLDRAWAYAVAAGYRAHELEDVALVADL